MSANTLAKFKSAEKTVLSALVHMRRITLAFNVQETEQEDFFAPDQRRKIQTD